MEFERKIEGVAFALVDIGGSVAVAIGEEGGANEDGDGGADRPGGIGEDVGEGYEGDCGDVGVGFGAVAAISGVDEGCTVGVL